jgi:hypothetical protein
LGAAIHLAPNSNGILKRFGIDAEKFGSNPTQFVGFDTQYSICYANEMVQLTEYTAEGKETRHIDLEEPSKLWQHVRMIDSKDS